MKEKSELRARKNWLSTLENGIKTGIKIWWGIVSTTVCVAVLYVIIKMLVD